jgi:hypothetical protein
MIDTLSHFRLWDSAAVAAEIGSLFQQIETSFLNTLSDKARQDTLFFIMADHGQVALPHLVYIEDHAPLQQALFMKPTGDPRVTYLYAKHGRQQQIIDYINHNLGDAMVALSSEQALAAGLFGPGGGTAVASERLGDVLVIMRQGFVLVTQAMAPTAKRLIGGHGSLTAAEMEVPWIGLRLDGW